MHLHAAAMVFESWAPSTEYPDQVGRIQCCGRSVPMAKNAIECPQCHTKIERDGDGWRIVLVKGRPPSTLADSRSSKSEQSPDQPPAAACCGPNST